MLIRKNITMLNTIINNKNNFFDLTDNKEKSYLYAYLRTIAQNVSAPEIDKDYWYERFYKILSEFLFMLDESTYVSGALPCGLMVPYFGFVYNIENENKILLRMNSVIHNGAKISINMDNVNIEPVEFINYLVPLLYYQSFNLGMYCLNMSAGHKNTLDFIMAKQRASYIKNFIFCIHISDGFMNSIIYKTSKKNLYLFDSLAQAIYDVGEPTIAFSDRINEVNTVPQKGALRIITSCGETGLFDNEGFVEGSINLGKMISGNIINYDRIENTVKTAVRLLNNTIDASYYDSSCIEETTKATRKIGIGITGFADMLIQLGVSYDSKEALSIAETIMKFINNEAHKASEELAKERGAFPLYTQTKLLPNPIRNASVTAISHAGFLPLITRCCMGIEPLFSTTTTEFTKKRLGKKDKLVYEYPYDENHKNVIKTAYSIAPEWHVKMQAIFQKYVDGSISKTINIPKSATIEDIKNIILLAHQLKCKGVAIYRKECNCEPTTIFREGGENDKKIDYDWYVNGADFL